MTKIKGLMDTTERTLYESPTARVIASEEPEDWSLLVLDAEKGVVYYHVERLEDGRWMNHALFEAPMFDKALRTEAATEALRLADVL